jgi:hypothetical protein
LTRRSAALSIASPSPRTPPLVTDVKTNSRKQARKTQARPVFSSLRKPNAPPGHPLSRAKPEERAHPAERKAKHKRAPGDGDG